MYLSYATSTNNINNCENEAHRCLNYSSYQTNESDLLTFRSVELDQTQVAKDAVDRNGIRKD